MLGNKIILSGGGTLGPVTPLLAIAKAYKQRHPFAEFIWLGTQFGPERRLVEKAEIKFVSIPSGKLRRYFSLANFFDAFKIIAAYFRCRKLLKIEKPSLLITAGGYVSVPLHWAAASLKIPTWVHQQDAVAGLANKLMAKSASLITVALETSLKFFPASKTRWIGNPVRDLETQSIRLSKQKFGIKDNEPVIFAVGGGTGAMRLNKILLESLSLLPKTWHIIHLVGLERSGAECRQAEISYPNYKVYDFFVDEMSDAYAAADVVFARGGFGTLTELASLSKTAILLPISGTHQEFNIRPFAEKQAVIQIDETRDTGVVLAGYLMDLAGNLKAREHMGEILHDMLPIVGDEAICGIIDELLSK